MTAFNPQNIGKNKHQNKDSDVSIKDSQWFQNHSSLNKIQYCGGEKTKQEVFAQNIFPDNQKVQQDFSKVLQVAKMEAVHATVVATANRSKSISIQGNSVQAKKQAVNQILAYAAKQQVLQQIDENNFFKQPGVMEELEKYFDEKEKQKMKDEVQPQDAVSSEKKAKKPAKKDGFKPGKLTAKVCTGVFTLVLGTAGLANHVEQQADAKKQSGAAAIEQQIKAKIESKKSTEIIEKNSQKQMGG